MRATPAFAALIFLSSGLALPPARAQTAARGPEAAIRLPAARQSSEDTATSPAAAVLAARPATGLCPPAPPVHACPPCEGAKRHVLPDGTVETFYTDGTVKRVRPDGTSLVRYADGTSEEHTQSATIYRDRDGNVVSQKSHQIMFMEVQSADPPDPPPFGSQLARWLVRHNADVLAALSAVLANEQGGPESLRQYLAGENGLDLYAQIARRTALLDRLLAP
ncbi:MAG TPA: T-complex 10 C-terminal domain-containing protein [Thermoanaerobaculia bacterium]|nr:T-complex 10 C-terminal domain-containing protein [Thermoanaerobaculia bacterium]